LLRRRRTGTTDTWDGVLIFSLSKALSFARRTAWEDLPQKIRDQLLNGIEEKIRMTSPPEAKATRGKWEGQPMGFGGIARASSVTIGNIGSAVRRAEHGGVARQGDGRAHVPRLQRRPHPRYSAHLHHSGKTIFDFGQLHFDELHAFLGTVKPVGRGAAAGRSRCSRRSAGVSICC
jgi:excinuclease ABC subunit A